MPEQNAQYLDLSNTENKKKNPRVIFEKKIDAIADFHNELATAGYHVETYVHYGADDSRHSWRDLIWKGDPTPLETPGATLNDDENGTYNSWFRRGLPTIVQGPLEAEIHWTLPAAEVTKRYRPTPARRLPWQVSRPAFGMAARARDRPIPNGAMSTRRVTTMLVPNGQRYMV